MLKDLQDSLNNLSDSQVDEILKKSKIENRARRAF